MLLHDLLVSPLEEVDVLGCFCENGALSSRQRLACLYPQPRPKPRTLLTLAGLDACVPSSGPPFSGFVRKDGTASRNSAILSFKFVRYFRSISLCAARSLLGLCLPFSVAFPCFFGGFGGAGRGCAAGGCGGETGFGPWLVLLSPNPAPKARGVSADSPPKSKFKVEPSPPAFGPGFMAMAISCLCSVAFKAGFCRPINVSMRIPGCGFSQLSGVE